MRRASGICLETERLRLREYREGDLADHHRLLSDPEVMFYLQDLQTFSLAESKRNLGQAMAAVGETPRVEVFLVIETLAGVYVGGIGYTVKESNPAGRRVEIGYFTHPASWGRGYAKEALKALVAYAFTHGQVYRVDGSCLADNLPSRRVMEACGLVEEGLKESYQWHEDRLKARCYYGLLKEDWKEGGFGRQDSD